jgi:hypothetical protein
LKNRWEEDDFYGIPCREVAPQGPGSANIDGNIAEGNAMVTQLITIATQAAKYGEPFDVAGQLTIWFINRVHTGGEWE